MAPRPATPSQTAGPFVSIGAAWAAATDNLVDDHDPSAIVVTGSVLDGAGMPVTDAMLEFWQADSEGRFPPASPHGWTGFARVLTDGAGCYRLVTQKPGLHAHPPEVRGSEVASQVEAPHIEVSIFARGLLQGLVTRIYFPNEPDNKEDPVLSSLSIDLRERLVAQLVTPDDAGSAVRQPKPVYHFEIYLQGERETVFFAP